MATTSKRGKIAALAAGLLVAVVLVEILLRVAGIGFPVFSRYDERLGRVLIPGAKGWFTQEGKAWVEINSHGFRDHEHAPAKPENTLRIALLGDSYAEAFQVDIEATFWSRLEEELALCPATGGRRVELLNFGVSGYSVAQEYLQLRQIVAGYAPDIVLLSLLTGNDVSDSHPALSDGMRPYFRYEGDDLVLDDGFLEHPTFRSRIGRSGRAQAWVLRRSRILQLVNMARINRRASGSPSPIGERGLRSEVYRPDPEGDWAEAWRVTEGVLQLIDRHARELEARLMVVTLSNGIQVDPDPARRAAFAAEIGVEDLLYPERRLREFADEIGIAMLNLAPELQRIAEREALYLHGWKRTGLGVGHWNEQGHARAAALMAPWICDALGETDPH